MHASILCYIVKAYWKPTNAELSARSNIRMYICKIKKYQEMKENIQRIAGGFKIKVLFKNLHWKVQ